MLQRQRGPSPVYRVKPAVNDDSGPRFTVEVLLDGKVAGSGSGGRKVDAERAAAVEAMSRMSGETGEDRNA